MVLSQMEPRARLLALGRLSCNQPIGRNQLNAIESFGYAQAMQISIRANSRYEQSQIRQVSVSVSVPVPVPMLVKVGIRSTTTTNTKKNTGGDTST